MKRKLIKFGFPSSTVCSCILIEAVLGMNGAKIKLKNRTPSQFLIVPFFFLIIFRFYTLPTLLFRIYFNFNTENVVESLHSTFHHILVLFAC